MSCTSDQVRQLRKAIGAWQSTAEYFGVTDLVTPPLNPDACDDADRLLEYVNAMSEDLLTGLSDAHQQEAWRYYAWLMGAEIHEPQCGPPMGKRKDVEPEDRNRTDDLTITNRRLTSLSYLGSFD